VHFCYLCFQLLLPALQVFFDSQTLSVDVAPYYVHFLLGRVHSVYLFGGGETPVPRVRENMIAEVSVTFLTVVALQGRSAVCCAAFFLVDCCQ
jgi:hypothetical protein